MIVVSKRLIRNRERSGRRHIAGCRGQEYEVDDGTGSWSKLCVTVGPLGNAVYRSVFVAEGCYNAWSIVIGAEVQITKHLTLRSLDAIVNTGSCLFITADCEPDRFIGGVSSPGLPERQGRNGTTSERAVDQFRSQVMDSIRRGRGFESHCNPTVWTKAGGVIPIQGCDGCGRAPYNPLGWEYHSSVGVGSRLFELYALPGGLIFLGIFLTFSSCCV